MIRSSMQRVRRVCLASSISLLFAAGAFAQIDPDPNSSTPMLLTETASLRALAQPEGKPDPAAVRPQAFPIDSRVMLFLNNVTLAPGEDAKAFRVYALDRDGHEYRFPVIDVRPFTDARGMYFVTIQLTDELGYWAPPAADGDVSVYLTWRGLVSNRVRVGIGQMGGSLKDAPDARPVPLGSRAAKPAAPDSPDAPGAIGYKWSGDRMRFLEQATFGPTAALDIRIRRTGIRSWLAEQFEAPYPSLTNPYPNHQLKPGTPPSDCDNNTTVPDVPATCYRDTYSEYQPQTWFFREALYSDAQLRHRVAWALGQVWVTSGVDIQQGRHLVEYHKVLSKHAFGNYRDLMKEMTLNPTMGQYLSMSLSTRNSPNENYAREIMQLFSVGLFMLNQDGTVQCVEHNPCQAGDTPIPTYDQNTVNNLTKVLTGWSFCSVAASCPNVPVGAVNYIDPMLLNPGVTNINNNRHDLTAKTLLTYPNAPNSTIPACTNCTTFPNITTYANTSMDQALDNIFNHPNVGPFVSKILIQHMVTSDPSRQYVSDIAAVFNNNGFGMRGDMKAVVKAILLHPEARGDVKTDPHFGKLREPVMFATNIMRSFNVRSANGLALSDGFMTGRAEFNGMAQVPFLAPTVFNYFPPDYIIPGTSTPGPEFAILTTGTAITRANFVNRFVFTAPAIAGGTTDAPNGTSLDFADLQELATADTTGNSLVEELNKRMLHYTMTPQMRSTILTAVTAVPATSTANFLLRVRQAVYLVATSSQYQVQR